MLTMGFLSWLFGDENLMSLLAQNWALGVWIVAAIVFCETGLVVLPFLPGDGLLFATGALLGAQGVSPWWPMGLITLAAILGDLLNYSIGRSALGQTLIRRGWVKPQHLAKTQAFFDRYGAPTITIGRFVPVVRTVAPFLAGLTGMCPRRFACYNVLGAVIWCGGLLSMGYWLGAIPWVQNNMLWLVLGMVALLLLPPLWQWRRSRRKG